MQERLLLHKALLGIALAVLFTAAKAPAAELRTFWVDAYHAGISNSADVAAMVATAKSNNYNAINVQVRKRGDCYYFPTAPNTEPRATGLASDYDPLREVCNQAHAQGLKVHAWITNNLVWSDSVNAPKAAGHVFNVHNDWLMEDNAGNKYLSEGYYLDPGVPDAMTWNYNVCMDLIQHYDIDALQFDYIRYPQQNAGYNPVAIARFNAEFNRSGLPSYTDSTFCDWRRRQVTDFVRKVYCNAMAVKPNIIIEASVFSDRNDAFTYRFQDWANWMSKGYMDANMPMDYATSNSTFNSRCDDAYNNRFGRHLYIAQGAYLNPVATTIAQLTYAHNKPCEGLGNFSYLSTNSEGVSNDTFYATLKSQLFTSPVAVPTMSWKTSPTQGILKGTVTDTQTGLKIYNATVTVGSLSEKTDGSGFYGITKVTPGTYSVRCAASSYPTTTVTATISAGGVTTVDFALDKAPPVISNVRATAIGANLATIQWDTDEVSTSQVEYGTTAGYGLSTTLDSTKVTSHSVSLTGLTPDVTYHYRVKSADAGGHLATSSDYTFFPTDHTAPVFPGLQSATDAMYAASSVNLAWLPATDVTPPVTYLIYASTTRGGEDFNNPIATTTDTSYMLSGLDFAKLTYFVVRAQDNADPPNVNTNTVEKSCSVTNVIEEAGAGGQNADYYFTLSGLSTNTTTKTTVTGSTVGITSKMGSALYNGSGTINRGKVIPPIPVSGLYRIYQSWGGPGPNCKNARYVTTFDGGTIDVGYLDQIGSLTGANPNKWVESATQPLPLMAGTDSYVTADDSENLGPANGVNTGRFYVDTMRFQYIGVAPAAPATLTATPGVCAVDLSWDPVVGANNYNIYRSTIAGQFEFVPIDVTSANTYTDTGVTGGIPYYYLVRATDAGDRAGFASPQATATPIPPTTFSTGSNGFVKFARWNLVSVPGDPLNADPLSVFSGIDVANSSMQYWKNCGDGGGYQLYGDTFGWSGPIARGTPYWFIETAGTAEDKDIRFDGFDATTDFDLSTCQHVASPFWIMFGTPFNSPIPADAIRFKNLAKRGDVWLNWLSAFSDSDPSLRIVESNAQGWDSSQSRFLSVTPTAYFGEKNQFDPWWGYWLLVDDPNELVIRFPMPR